MRRQRSGIVGASLWFAMTTAVLLLSAFTSGHAQRFEFLYGGPTFTEAGWGGVQPLAGGGYVAVGHSFTPSGGVSNDIYVVKFANNGVPVWANTYSIGKNDSAACIRECASGGFIVTGITDTNVNCQSRRDIFLLRLNGAGNVLWAKTYGTLDAEEAAWCVVEAKSGDPDSSMSAGDFIVAGYRYISNGMGGIIRQEAYLMRTTSTGTLLWDKGYTVLDGSGNPVPNCWFQSLAEASAVAPALTGDIIATGSATNPGGTSSQDAFVIRVDGNTGRFTFPGGNHGSLIWGTSDAEYGFSVQELKVGAQAGQIAVVGGRYVRDTTIPSPPIVMKPIEWWVFKTGANPSAGTIAQHRYKGNGTVYETGTWIEEIKTGTSGLTAGNLIVAGAAELPGNGSNAMMVELNPATLTPVALGAGASYSRYGAGNWTSGFSVSPVATGGGRTAGFVMVGMAKAPPDPMQVYAVKTDNLGSSCSVSRQAISHNGISIAQSVPTVQIDNIGLSCTASVAQLSLSNYIQLCYSLPKASPEEGADDISSAGGATAGNRLLSFPNPVTRGNSFTLTCTLAKNAEVAIEVADMSGRTVHAETRNGNAGEIQIPVSTEGWSAGIYVVKMTVGRDVMMRKIVVSDK